MQWIFSLLHASLLCCMLFQLTHAYSQLVQYRDKYRSRFNAFNLLYLGQIIFIVGKLIGMLGKLISEYERHSYSRDFVHATAMVAVKA